MFRFFTFGLAAVLLASIAAAQPAESSPFDYAYETIPGGASVAVQPNGNILFGDVRLGTSRTIRLSFTNRTQSAWTLTEASVIGAGFSAAFAALSIPAQSAVGIELTFQPRSAGVGLAVATVVLTDSANSRHNVTFQLSGAAPLDNLAALWATDRTTFQPMDAGATLRLPATRVSSVTQATLRLVGTTGTLTLTGVQLMGTGFELASRPELPSSINSTRFAEIPIRFSPTTGAAYAGALILTFGPVTVSFPLEGAGVGADLEVSASLEGEWSVVASGATSVFPAVQAGAGTAVREFRVRNKGDAEGRVATISVSGTAYRLTGLPELPKTLGPGEEFRFSVEFAPSAPGEAAGSLRVDGLTFSLSGAAFEQNLGVTVVIGERRLRVVPGVVALLPNTPVGSRLDFAIEVANAGDRPASVSSVSMSGQSFSLNNVPLLPATIPPGQSLRLGAVFIPAGVTTASATLQIDVLSLILRGAGGPPPNLNSARLTGLPNPAEPAQLPAVGVELAGPYESELNGTLTLEFSPALFVDDPSILFVNGRKTIDFRVPAGSTTAVFPGGSSVTSFQSGTTAGTITLTAQFLAGTVAVPSSSPLRASVNIAPGPPQLRSVRVTEVAATYIELQISGFSTARSVSRLILDLAGTPGGNLRTEQVEFDVRDQFNAWYQNAASRAFGGQFTTTVRLQINGDANAVESIGVSAINDHGASMVIRTGLRLLN